MNPIFELSEISQKIGQLFIGGIPGPVLDENSINIIKDYHLGGIILFSRNVTDPVQLASLCKDLQRVSMENSGLPLFLAIDQEGGRVARLKEPFTQFPGNAAMGENPNSEQGALQFARTTAREMSLVGLNMNMAPVLDVAQPNMEPHLVGRCFSHEPLLVTRLGKIVINTLQQGGIMAVAKHFPGLGNADLDPHLQLPTINATYEEMESIHLPPFASAIEANVSAVMSSHAIYPALEPGMPATLSRKIITDLLRERMQFDGLIISDDLEMGAIAKERGLPEGAADAFEAGIDLLLICSNQAHLLDSIEVIRDRLLKGDIPYERLESSSERIARYKRRFLHPSKRISLKAVREYFGIQV
ncbi:MAG: beta-N-acetylhexosaminidase [Deltaproteobacteria bacterium]|nr:MAG: beta-N-acetylhexosaminidase [Deltaproteobacteria bacterium]